MDINQQTITVPRLRISGDGSSDHVSVLKNPLCSVNNRGKYLADAEKIDTFAFDNTDCYGAMGTHWYWRNFSRAEEVFDKSLG